MEIDRGENLSPGANTGEGKKETKQIILVLMGVPGSGKSTFCEEVMNISSRSWVRVCQDNINNGKVGTKNQCLSLAASALKDGKSVFIDRCNIDREQRVDFLNLGGPQAVKHAIVLDLPAKLCISRSVKRTGHEGNLQGGRAAAVVNQMAQKKELPKLSEGFSRITFCQDERDVKEAINVYGSLGPLDSLPSGCFGQKRSDTKIQQGIMKFLKKPDPSSKVGSVSTVESRPSSDVLEKSEKNDEFDNMPTLAFPSISTADFQFDIAKASDIIVEKVVEFLPKIGRARLVLVDLSKESTILSLVTTKAAMKKINTNKFFTFVGDITRLRSEKGLHCSVIANAANWRLRPGGGGVNAAIYKAAGPVLETATKEKAESLAPGKCVVVPLPSSSPLFTREGVTHVIHALGPNMNPQRPDCLKDDYVKGCKILREAYTSLFEGFVSILRSQGVVPADDDHNAKRVKVNNAKARAPWFRALHDIAMHPHEHKDVVHEKSDDFVVINDAYPKAQRHLLVLARAEGLDGIADVGKEHIELLKTMHAVGLKWVEKFLNVNKSLVFRLGYHSVPSMQQLHLHVISQDFDSPHLKNKKHWNSFTTPFFLDSVDVIKELEDFGKVTVKDDKATKEMELRCHRCRSVQPSIPRLKSHIASCRAPFPAALLQNGRLVSSEGIAC